MEANQVPNLQRVEIINIVQRQQIESNCIPLLLLRWSPRIIERNQYQEMQCTHAPQYCVEALESLRELTKKHYWILKSRLKEKDNVILN